MSDKSSSAASLRLYLCTHQTAFGLTGDIQDRSVAGAALFTLDQSQPQSIAFTLIVPNEIPYVVACIGVLTRLNLRVDPCAHGVRHGNV